jgi:hypothetical protein
MHNAPHLQICTGSPRFKNGAPFPEEVKKTPVKLTQLYNVSNNGVGLVYRVYGVNVPESKVNDLWIYGVGLVFRVYGVKVLDCKVNDLWIYGVGIV